MQSTKLVLPYGAGSGEKRVQVEQMFDKISPRYDLLNRILSLGIDRGWRKKLRKKVAALHPTLILDVATGTADVAIELSKIPGVQIIGSDISEGMLSSGRVKLKRKNLNSRITLESGDVASLQYPRDTFDAVTVAFGVRNFQYLDDGLLEIYRVIKPGGKVFILEFSKPGNRVVGMLYHFYFRYVTPRVGGWISGSKEAYKYLPASVANFPSGNGFLQHLKSSHFVNTESTPLTFGICTLYIGQKR